jgi:orotate phosphoribosyltransferase
MVSGGVADEDNVQISRVFHTGADPMERIAARPTFEGLVNPSAIHILVDDVTTMGGTLAELADFIQIRGGLIGGVLVIDNAGRVKNLCPSRAVVRKIENRFGHELEQILG